VAYSKKLRKGNIRVWTINEEVLQEYDIPNNDEILSMVLVDKEVWTGCTNKTVRVFDLKAQCTATMVEHNNDVKSILLVDNQVWTGSMDETIAIFDKYTKQKTNIITPKIGPIGCLRNYSQDNQKFLYVLEVIRTLQDITFLL